jgi:hypothetical protein
MLSTVGETVEAEHHERSPKVQAKSLEYQALARQEKKTWGQFEFGLEIYLKWLPHEIS